MKKTEEPVFKDTDCYVDFCKQHKVFGQQAIDLKKKMDSLKQQGEKINARIRLNLESAKRS